VMIETKNGRYVGPEDRTTKHAQARRKNRSNG
jgi:hypothetical protein